MSEISVFEYTSQEITINNTSTLTLSAFQILRLTKLAIRPDIQLVMVKLNEATFAKTYHYLRNGPILAERRND